MKLLAILLLALVGCGNNDVEQYCREAIILAQLFEESEDTSAELDACTDRVKEDLMKLSPDARDEADECIHCIAETEEEECGCCSTNGGLDILETDCSQECDSDGFREFCEL